MTDSTSAAMTAVAAAEASRAAEEHRQACVAMMPTFVDAHASVESKRAYAGCVDTVYPNPMTHDERHQLQICVLIVIACGVAGAIWLDDINGFEGRFLGALGGLLGGAVAIAVLYFLGWVFL